MGSTTVSWRAALALAAVGLAGVGLAAAAAGASAQDAPAAPVLETVKDPRGLVSIGVPKGSVAAKLPAEDDALLAGWTADLDPAQEGPEIIVYAFSRTSFARAELAGSMGRGCRWGAQEPDSVEVRNGEWRERRIDREKNALYSQRIVAAKGQVFFAVAQTKPLDLDRYRAHVDAVLASFQPLEASKATRIPESYKVAKAGGGEVWSDAKKNETDRVVREWTSAMELWAKVVPDKPVMTNPPRLVLCAKDPDYEAVWGEPGSVAPPRYAYYSQTQRAVVVRLSLRQEDASVQAVHRATGEQMSHRTYGGMTPVWWEQGLRVYLSRGLLSNGHFDQAEADTIEKARNSAVERNVTFADILGMTEMPRGGRDGIDRELYAWHWYFRHGPGAKSMGARYRAFAQSLRTTGDVREAAKSFDDVDHEKLRADYLEWIRHWREGG